MITEATKLKKGKSLKENKYRVIEPLTKGEGAFGCVYKIEELHEHFDARIRALKQFHYESNDEQINNEAKDAFKAEAKTQFDLDIEFIPKVHDLFIENDDLFLVMDYIEGITLQDIIAKNKPPLDQAILIIEKLLETVSSLHLNDPQIIHRDIKPLNIIIENGNVWLVDFGAAKNSKFGTILRGTYSEFYSSPEQSRGLSTDETGDIYSIGASFYYLLTSKKPTDSYKRYNAIEKNEEDPLQDIDILEPEIPKLIADVVHKSMAMNPKDRYPSASEMLEALREANRKINNADEYYNEGMEFIERKEWNKAIASFEEVTRLKPNFSDAFFRLGYCYGKTDQDQIAIQYYSEALKLNPEDTSSLHNRAISYGKIGDPINKIIDISRTLELSDKTLHRSWRIRTCIELIKSDLDYLIKKTDPTSNENKELNRKLSTLNDIDEMIPKRDLRSLISGVVIGISITLLTLLLLAVLTAPAPR